MGCLQRLFSIIILVLAFIGFQSIGGVEFCKKTWNEFVHPDREDVLKAKSAVDFSMLSDEYEIQRPVEMMGYKFIFAHSEANNQKMLILDADGHIQVSKKDFYSDKIDKVLEAALRKIAYQAIRVEHLRIMSSGTFQGMEQEIPYITFEVDTVRMGTGKLYGMLGVVNAPDGQNDLVLSFGADRDYDQLIAQRFFQTISYKTVKSKKL